MREWNSGSVQANGLKIHFTRTGGDKPALVLLHGITDDGLCWTPVAEALASEFDVVMVDARGHGHSEAPANGYDDFTQAEDLVGLIEALQLSNPILLGHSMGALTTLTLAGMHPHLPRAIVLEDPPALWMPAQPPDPEEIEARERWRATLAGFKQKSRQTLLSEQRQAAPSWSEAELQPWVDSKQRFSLQVLQFDRRRGDGRQDLSETIERISCPGLLITGDPNLGAIVEPESASVLKNRYGGKLEIAHIPGAGHSIRRDQFDGFMAAVSGFLAAL